MFKSNKMFLKVKLFQKIPNEIIYYLVANY